MNHLGQHFLKNAAVLQSIIAALELRAGDAVIEIGSGHGELTLPLAKKMADLRGTFVAIEKDLSLVSEVKNEIEKMAGDHLVLQGDALKMLPGIIAALTAETYKLVGNLPYYITGHLLRAVSELQKKPERCVFMLQKEVAERIVARPPKMNRLAASVQFWAEPRLIGLVSKKDFSPMPTVDSALLLLKTNRQAAPPVDPARYYAAVRILFAQPRKTILNNLAAGGKRKKEEVLHMIEKISLNPRSRPQDLDIGNIFTVATTFFE
jgi:16S rRNA (adenine1518-N6/adenine1519-N6)-dimethyltransferase